MIIEVFNTMGQKIETLVSGNKNAGEYKYLFNANGKGYNAGTYFVRIVVNEKTVMKRIVDIR